MNNNTSVKVEINIPQAFQAELEIIRKNNPQLGFENIEELIREATRLYTQQLRADKAKITIPPSQIAINEAVVTTLEAVWTKINEINEPSDLQHEIAGDLIAARTALETAKNGQANPENIKKWAIELFA
jgi:hypothetical protein